MAACCFCFWLFSKSRVERSAACFDWRFCCRPAAALTIELRRPGRERMCLRRTRPFADTRRVPRVNMNQVMKEPRHSKNKGESGSTRGGRSCAHDMYTGTRMLYVSRRILILISPESKLVTAKSSQKDTTSPLQTHLIRTNGNLLRESYTGSAPRRGGSATNGHIVLAHAQDASCRAWPAPSSARSVEHR